MATPASTDEFLDLVRKSGVTDERRFNDYVTKSRAANGLAPDAPRMAGLLVRDGILTQFQAEQILQGKWRRFTIGKYKVLERIGSGGMGSVYLCEHKLMRRRVAVKVLPTAKATDPSALERFYREARAVAALDHPNIVHAYDIDQDEQLHFLVMEYVDGSNLQDIVKKAGPLDILRSCHYVRQAALGLEHANNAGLVHRDIKPGNILVDRSGLVKILDMGLARFFNDEEDMLTKKFDENVLGTADYLAPEQAIDSHAVDVRADIYSLGATFYFMLTGRTPFGEGTIAQKLLWHQTRQPKPVSEYRKEVPPELVAVISKMMDKEPAHRYQLPAELADALAPFTATPIGPPPEAEMPILSRAASGIPQAEQSSDPALTEKSEYGAAARAPQGMGSANARLASGSGKSGSSADTANSAAASYNTPMSPTPKARPNANARPSSADAPAAARPAANLPTPRRAPGAKEKPSETTGAVAGEAVASSESAIDFQPNSAKKNAKPGAATSARTRKRILIAIAVMAIVAGGAAAAFFLLANPFPRQQDQSVRKLEITADPMTKTGPFTFRKVVDALKGAQKGDIIQLNDEVHVEQLSVDFEIHRNIPSDIIIRPAPGKQVTWRTSNKARADLPVVFLTGAANLKIQGPDLILDGTLDFLDRLHDVVKIRGNAPGFTLENVRIQSFEIAALKIENASGAKDRPIRFVDCEFAALPKEKTKAGVAFDANPKDAPAVNDYIDFVRPKFDGLKKHFIELKAGALGKHVTGVDLGK